MQISAVRTAYFHCRLKITYHRLTLQAYMMQKHLDSLHPRLFLADFCVN
jgi:hypothetical protein